MADAQSPDLVEILCWIASFGPLKAGLNSPLRGFYRQFLVIGDLVFATGGKASPMYPHNRRHSSRVFQLRRIVDIQ